MEKYGEVTDFFNPGRGFAFITFSTNEEAQACIKGMDNTEVRSTLVKFEIQGNHRTLIRLAETQSR